MLLTKEAKPARRILPHFKIVQFDETRYWTDAQLVEDCGGQILGTYLFDRCRVVYCCEMTPSYELNFLESVPGRMRDCYSMEQQRLLLPIGNAVDDPWLWDYGMAHESFRDAVQMALMEGDHGTDRVRYVHTRDVERFTWIDVWKFTRKEWGNLVADADENEEKAYDAALEACFEYVHTHGLY